MSMLLRARSAWRVASQPKRAASLQFLQPPASLSPWLRRRDSAGVASVFSRGGLRALSSSAASSSDGATVTDSAARDALLTKLQPLCRSLYREHREPAQSIDDLLAPWQTQLSALLQSEPRAPAVQAEIAQTYEQGIAIALKQREFDLAQALLTQMQSLGLAAHDELFVYQIRAVPLQWISRSRPLALNALELGPQWERTVLGVVNTEHQPHYRKSPTERKAFRTFVRDGVKRVLHEYEASVPTEQQTVAPYNAAVRAFASNGLPFASLLRVLSDIPQGSPVRKALNTETFVALLQGARWQDIPITLERLAASNAVRKELEQQDLASAAADIWDQAMRSICNSYTDRVLDKRTPLERRLVRELQNIYVDVDAQLQRVFPSELFAAMDDTRLTEVFEIRVKAAAQLGLPRQVHVLLNEFKALIRDRETDGKSVFLKALEIFPSVGLKRVKDTDVHRMRSHPDVLESREVLALQRSIEDLETNVIPPLKAQYLGGQATRAAKKTTVETDEKEDAEVAETKTADEAESIRRELRQAQDDMVNLKKRLRETKENVALRITHANRLRAADKSIAIVLEHLKKKDDEDPRKDLDVAVAIMNQYMTTGNRFGTAMEMPTRKRTASHILRRASELLNVAVGRDPVASDTSDEDRAKMETLFALAIKTAALFWCEKDLNALVQRKKTVLGNAQLGVEDYDRLVFMRVVQFDVDGAMELLQEMHYAGVAPTPTTIHRIIIGALHRRYYAGGKNKTTTKKDQPKQKTKSANAQDETALDDAVLDEIAGDIVQQGDDLEEDDDDAAGFSRSPRRLEDMATFIQDWYNLYRVKPLAKTVVPVFARLLATNKVWEVRRLLQILESMDGGLTPATEFWLEKRLAAVGKSADDLRIPSTRR